MSGANPANHFEEMHVIKLAPGCHRAASICEHAIREAGPTLHYVCTYKHAGSVTAVLMPQTLLEFLSARTVRGTITS